MKQSNNAPRDVQIEDCAIHVITGQRENALPKLLELGVTPESFYLPENALLFAHCLKLYGRGEPTNRERLLLDGMFCEEYSKQIGSSLELKFNSIAGKFNEFQQDIEFIGQKLVELQKLRQLALAASYIQDKVEAYSGQGLVETFMPTINKASDILCDAVKSIEWVDQVAKAKERVEEMIAGNINEVSKDAVNWFLPSANNLFKPMEPGELVVVAARPSVGKSSFMRQQSWKAFLDGKHVLVHNHEVAGVEYALNLATNISGVKVRSPLSQAPRDIQDKVRDAFAQMADERYTVIDSDAHIDSMLARARSIKTQRGLNIWCIDYLGLIAECGGVKGKTQSSSIGEVCRQLKQFAVNENCVVMLLCQLNRLMEREGRKPNAADLRDSGNIEEHADRVIFLHRPPKTRTGVDQSLEQNSNELPEFELEVIQAKGRNTGTASFFVDFNRTLATFKQYTFRENPANTQFFNH